MQRQAGHDHLRRPDHTHVLHDDPVHAHVMQKDQIILQLRQLLIVHQRIHRHVQTYVMHVTEVNGPRHLFPVKVAGVGPGPEGLPAQIDRICPGVYRCFQCLPCTSGGK